MLSPMSPANLLLRAPPVKLAPSEKLSPPVKLGNTTVGRASGQLKPSPPMLLKLHQQGLQGQPRRGVFGHGTRCNIMIHWDQRHQRYNWFIFFEIQWNRPEYFYPNRTQADHLALVAKRKGRANNTAWCQCGYCDPMLTDEDSVCCREDWYFNRIISMVSYEENHCYALAPMTYMALRENDLDDYRAHFLTNDKRHLVGLYGVDFRNRTQQLWRWLAYRYIIRGVNLMTEYDKGRFNETLPACIVKAVRGEFPEPDNKYRETGWSVFQSIRLPG
ncbi:hypothetical protein WDU94_008497 [Cyamophila willieti]